MENQTEILAMAERSLKIPEHLDLPMRATTRGKDMFLP